MRSLLISISIFGVILGITFRAHAEEILLSPEGGMLELALDDDGSFVMPDITPYLLNPNYLQQATITQSPAPGTEYWGPQLVGLCHDDCKWRQRWH